MSGHTDKSDLRSPAKVSDIWISNLWSVECADHGVIDECRTFRAAVQVRREHFFEVHREDS